MEKYSKENAATIVDMLRSDTYTINEVCAAVHICKYTFYNWQKLHPEFAEMVESARKELNERMVLGAKRSLLRKITGYDTTETRVTMIPSGKLDASGKAIAKVKSETRITRHIEPDITAIIFVLTNLDPEHWKNRKDVKVSGKDEPPHPVKEMSDEELERIISELESKLETGGK